MKHVNTCIKCTVFGMLKQVIQKGQDSVSTVVTGYQQLSDKKKTGVNSRVTARSFTKGHKSLAKIKLQLVNISRNVYTVKSNENDRFKDQHVNK